MAYQPDVRWIIPPGLAQKIPQFEAHCKVAIEHKANLLILGDTGIGKTLFLKLYEKQYREANPNFKAKPNITSEEFKGHCSVEKVSKIGREKPILIVNCAHFKEDLARSELFGHEKGAFTGAAQKKAGWVEKADNGLLILEEIGELPQSVQAELLTFIESGYYHRVGGTELLHAEVNVVGATNDPGKLRTDFYHRFFPFRIPPLRERRGDILYYLASKNPGIIASLRPWEILSLLAYHWPGNVREIERIAMILERNIRIIEESGYETKEGILDVFGGVMAAADSETDLGSYGRLLYLTEDLKAKGVNFDRLERVLNLSNVGLNVSSKRKPFKRFKESSFVVDKDKTDKYGATWLNELPYFNVAQLGLKLFCDLFFQSEYADYNLLDQEEFAIFTLDKMELNDKSIRPSVRSKFPELRLSLLVYFLGIDQDELKQATDEIAAALDPKKPRPGRTDILKMLSNRFPDNVFLNRLFHKGHERKEGERAEVNDFLSMKQVNLLEKYYRHNLINNGWKVKTTAEALGIPVSTLRDYLKKHNINRDTL